MKTLKTLLAFVAIVLVTALSARAGIVLTTPCLKSTLCSGLLEVYEFEEASDSPRFGQFRGQLQEPNSQNVGNAAGRTDGSSTGNAVDFTASVNSYLWANGGGGLPKTTAFWLYVDAFPAVGQSMSILSRRDTSRKGPDVYLQTVTGATDNQLCLAYWSVDSETAVVVCTADLATATWYHFVLGTTIAKDASGVPTGTAPYIATNGTTFVTGSTIGFQVHPGSWQIRIGNGNAGAGPDGAGANAYDGRLDQLSFWSRELTNAEIVLLYNGGNRLPYPFVTE